MKVEIELPDEITLDYAYDKFRDFFSRVIADVDCAGCCGTYEKEIAESLKEAFEKSKVLSW